MKITELATYRVDATVEEWKAILMHLVLHGSMSDVERQLFNFRQWIRTAENGSVNLGQEDWKFVRSFAGYAKIVVFSDLGTRAQTDAGGEQTT